jgi:hypothetical protein
MSDKVWAIFELVVAVALLLSLALLLIPADKAKRIARFIKKFFLGGN